MAITMTPSWICLTKRRCSTRGTGVHVTEFVKVFQPIYRRAQAAGLRLKAHAELAATSPDSGRSECVLRVETGRKGPRSALTHLADP